MKRAGFTMIELIFVIVILGILASVAVPKLIGVKDSAEEGLVKSFVGSLNTTIAPAKWSQSLMDGRAGDITNAVYYVDTNDTEFPSGIVGPIETTNCDLNGTTQLTLGTGSTWAISCRNGTADNAPKFFYMATTTTPTSTMVSDAETAHSLKLVP